MMSEAHFQVIAVDLRTKARRVIAVDKSKENAEAIVKMAVMRRGVEDEIFYVQDMRGKDGTV